MLRNKWALLMHAYSMNMHVLFWNLTGGTTWQVYMVVWRHGANLKLFGKSTWYFGEHGANSKRTCVILRMHMHYSMSAWVSSHPLALWLPHFLHLLCAKAHMSVKPLLLLLVVFKKERPHNLLFLLWIHK